MSERLVDFYVDWVSAADAGIRGVDELDWHRRFVAEWNNVRAAMSWAIERDAGDAACTIIWHLGRWAHTRLRVEVGAAHRCFTPSLFT